MRQLIMVAKSPWLPSIRREHALADEAIGHDVAVTFVEAPNDVRALRPATAPAWLRRLGISRHRSASTGPVVVERSTFVPGHRHPLAAAADNALLGRQLRRLITQEDGQTAVVVNLPWQWPAVAGLPARRIFDAADDWNALLGEERSHVRTLYRRVAAEADVVIIANPALEALFDGRDTVLVPNGTPADLVQHTPHPRPFGRRLVYAGTLTHRFDAELMGAVLTLLPGWQLDLYGECRYPGYRTEPAPELVNLLSRYSAQVRWHGVVSRSELGPALDAADVAVVPHRIAYTHGQSSMKLADYAARGRPIVRTTGDAASDADAPPGTWTAGTAGDFAAAVVAAYSTTQHATPAVAWARERTWPNRWPAWSAAVFDSAPA
ncbi:glycosyltransferase [Dactylosporangium vinaceum]|uniref:Glycosyltransferase n=1 Tax=Dactylosporangium vinaceum TaxID=53362 RepID=A0ABV5MII2_9ACTN|nr:glycosyltransferase [Dactylosporangium vinaceum]UAB97612.1 glycosyltransferase [Dactylosporangium vinaceum]